MGISAEKVARVSLCFFEPHCKKRLEIGVGASLWSLGICIANTGSMPMSGRRFLSTNGGYVQAPEHQQKQTEEQDQSQSGRVVPTWREGRPFDPRFDQNEWDDAEEKRFRDGIMKCARQHLELPAEKQKTEADLVPCFSIVGEEIWNVPVFINVNFHGAVVIVKVYGEDRQGLTEGRHPLLIDADKLAKGDAAVILEKVEAAGKAWDECVKGSVSWHGSQTIDVPALRVMPVFLAARQKALLEKEAGPGSGGENAEPRRL